MPKYSANSTEPATPDQPTQRVSAFGDSGSRVALILRGTLRRGRGTRRRCRACVVELDDLEHPEAVAEHSRWRSGTDDLAAALANAMSPDRHLGWVSTSPRSCSCSVWS